MTVLLWVVLGLAVLVNAFVGGAAWYHLQAYTLSSWRARHVFLPFYGIVSLALVILALISIFSMPKEFSIPAFEFGTLGNGGGQNLLP